MKIVRGQWFLLHLYQPIFFFNTGKPAFYYSVIASLQYKNNLLVGILITTIALVCIILFVAFINHFFKFKIPDVSETIISIAAGF